MSQPNNNNTNTVPSVETESNLIKTKFNLDELDCLDCLGLETPRLTRSETIRGPLILVRDSDLYILSNGTNKVIKSWITDKEVPNRRLNEKTGYLEKIDPSIEEEDRRLLIPNAILAENY
jgi:hypothetical protein